MSRQVLRQKAELDYERKKAMREEVLAAMSDEERVAYKKQQEERYKSALKLLSVAASISTISHYGG